MGRHRRECNHDWKLIFRKWCYTEEKLNALREQREPEWLDTFECRLCTVKDVRKHDPNLPPPKANS